jgi:O-methyltransferase
MTLSSVSMGLATRLRGVVRGETSSGPSPEVMPDASEAFNKLCDRVRPFTMTSVERLYALHEAVRYVVAAKVPGDIVECGVWRGGSSMMAALTLRELGAGRRIWLYDTFEGMPPPGENDVRYSGESAESLLESAQRSPGAWNEWAWATLDDVRDNMTSTGHDAFEYVAGPIEETVPANAPAEIALLRLDTDWYESTRHELQHLYPRLAEGGVLIIDDYGHWQGARRAVNEYFADRPILLNRIDYTGRIAVKPASQS